MQISDLRFDIYWSWSRLLTQTRDPFAKIISWTNNSYHFASINACCDWSSQIKLWLIETFLEMYFPSSKSSLFLFINEWCMERFLANEDKKEVCTAKGVELSFFFAFLNPWFMKFSRNQPSNSYYKQ